VPHESFRAVYRRALSDKRDVSNAEFEMPENLQGQNLDPKLVELIFNEIMGRSPQVHWDDIGP
jgi:chorismate mutase